MFIILPCFTTQKMWQDTLRVSADASHDADEIPKIVVNGYTFAERCQRLGKAIEWIKREMVSIDRAVWLVQHCIKSYKSVEIYMNC